MSGEPTENEGAEMLERVLSTGLERERLRWALRGLEPASGETVLSLGCGPGYEPALSELRRVLRPGGRAVVVSRAVDSQVLHGSDRDRTRRVLRAYRDAFPNADLATRSTTTRSTPGRPTSGRSRPTASS
jgi:ubiquinone/menaquinone biosynthesis C-methylase UbiE